jgi:hypothetical protein
MGPCRSCLNWSCSGHIGKIPRIHSFHQTMNPNVIYNHCILWHALASNILPSCLQDMLDVVHSVNWIPAGHLNHSRSKCCAKRQGLDTLYLCFTQEYTRYQEGKFWLGFFELWDLRCFWVKRDKPCFSVSYIELVISFAYLAYVFEVLNLLNISLQGTEVTILGDWRKSPVL